MSTKNYLKKNNNYWSEPYNAENVESYIFRLKGGLLDKFISKKKNKSIRLWLWLWCANKIFDRET